MLAFRRARAAAGCAGGRQAREALCCPFRVQVLVTRPQDRMSGSLKRKTPPAWTVWERLGRWAIRLFPDDVGRG
jgi:hypothetical protein